MYLGNYTREEKMCPQGAAFLPYSLESVLSSERLSKNFVFPTICVLTAQNTSRPKVPVRKLSPSESIKTEVHAPGFYAFAPQMLLHARCRAAAVSA